MGHSLVSVQRHKGAGSLSHIGILGLVLLAAALVGSFAYMSLNRTADDVLTHMAACAILLFCLYKGFKEPVLLNPFFLFSLAPFALLVYDSEISPLYLLPLTIETRLLALLCMVAFLLGIELSFRRRSHGRSKSSILSLSLPENRVTAFCVGAIIIGSAGTLFPSIPFSSVFKYFVFVGIAGAFAYRKWALLALQVVICLIPMVYSFNKTNFVRLALALLVCYEIYRVGSSARKRARLIIYVIVCAAFVLFVSFVLKSFMQSGQGSLLDIFSGTELGLDSGQYYILGRSNWGGPEILLRPYLYLTTPLTNLQYLMQTSSDFTYGAWLIKPVLGWVGMEDLLASAYKMYPHEPAYTTFSFIAVMYKDFGGIGAVVESFALGMFVKYVYAEAITRQSFLGVAVYAVVLFAVVEMFFNNHFFQIGYPFLVMLLAAAVCLVCRKRYGLAPPVDPYDQEAGQSNLGYGEQSRRATGRVPVARLKGHKEFLDDSEQEDYALALSDAEDLWLEDYDIGERS